MRSVEEQNIALECLKLAHGEVSLADQYYAFVSGSDVADAKRKLDIIRDVSRS